jgi:hypothetical protein
MAGEGVLGVRETVSVAVEEERGEVAECECEERRGGRTVRAPSRQPQPRERLSQLQIASYERETATPKSPAPPVPTWIEFRCSVRG